MRRLLEDFQSVLNRGLAILNGCTEKQARWKPGPDQWSVLECVDHARETLVSYQEKIDKALAVAAPGSGIEKCTPGWRGRVFAYSMEPPYAFKMKTFRSFHPQTEMQVREVREAFVRDFRRFMKTLEKASKQHDLSTIIISSPVTRLVKMSVCDAAVFLAAHSRRHLWQAEQLAQWPGYPKD